MPPEPEPPRAARRPHVHTGGGLRRDDPYAWMGDRSPAGAAELLEHLRAERAHYAASTAGLAPLRAALLAESGSRTPVADSSISWRHGGWVYHTRRPAGKEYTQFVRVPEPDRNREPTVLLDEDDLAEAPGGHVELGVRAVSPGHDLLAYSVDTDGDERYALRFRDLATGRDLPDAVPHGRDGVAEGGAWLDRSTFLWLEVDAAWRPWRVRRHRVGSTGPDPVVLEEPDEAFSLSVRRTRSGRLVVLTAESTSTVQEWLLPTDDPGAAPRPVAPRVPGVRIRVEHAPGPAGDLVVAVTDEGHAEGRLVAAPLTDVLAGEAAWSAVVPPGDGERLLGVDAFARHLVLSLRRGGAPLLRFVPLAGRRTRARSVDVAPSLPAGTVSLGPAEEPDVTTVAVREGSYTEPARWVDVDLATGVRGSELHREAAPAYDPAAHVSERRWVRARDGTEVPVTLTRAVSTPLDGTAPCLVYAYGAYEAVDEPTYDPVLPCLWDRGVVFAHAHVRGGGELGRAWWDAGRGAARTPTTFADLEDVADALAAGLEGCRVDGAAMATRGLSAGGLLQAAVLGRRPDRWRVVVAEVPFVDVVTTMLDATLPLTAVEREEWGDPRDPAAAAAMAAWSPYDGVVPGPRPLVLVTGAVHDARVMVHEPAKWVAALRHADPSPVLFRVETGAGVHGGPAGRQGHLAYEADVLAVVLDALGRGSGRASG